MIEDILKHLGFKRKKNYRKRKIGVSAYSWFHGNSEIFTIEKHHCGDCDEGNTFYPTFNHSNIVIVIDSTKDILFIMKILRLECNKIDKLDKYLVNMVSNHG